MRRAFLSLQVLLLMCTPLPQASYAAVGLGRRGGLAMLRLLALYAISDAVALLLITWALRRVTLPARVRALVDRAAQRAQPVARRGATLPALFAVGFVSLYTVGVIAGLSRVRLLPALTAGIAGDLVQFTGTVALGGLLARLLPFPGADWVFLLAAPLLVATLPGAAWAVRSAVGTVPRSNRRLPGVASF